MLEPLVSVCIQTYKHEEYIAECLESIIKQETIFPYEIIIGEDDSPDATREICQRYADQYPNKIKLFLRSRNDVIYVNGMPTGRYNFFQNLKACKGKYIAICPGDDFWRDTKKLQKQVDILEQNSNVSLVYTNALIKSDSGGDYQDERLFFDSSYPANPIKDQAFYLKNNFALLTVSIMFRSKDFTEEDQKRIANFATGDMPLYFVLSGKGDFYYLNQTCVVYNDHGGGISKTLNKTKRNLINYANLNNIHGYIKAENRVNFNYFSHKYLIGPIFNGMFRSVKEKGGAKVNFSELFFIKFRHFKVRYFYYILKLVILKATR